MTVRRTGHGHRRTAVATLVGVVSLGSLLGACSGSTSAGKPTTTVRPTTTTTAPPAPTTTSTTAPVPAPTWLCRPGMAGDPCLADLTTTVVSPGGRARVVPVSPAADPKIDCFYVYPTVSVQTTANADLAIDPQERAVAVAQASRFSQVCNVYAPVYRQLTVAAISGKVPVNPADRLIAYSDVLNAWNYYLAHDNHGRGVAFIGHSQGAAMLITLIKAEVDPNPSVRARLVSAILLGGNVTVPVGALVGGTFDNIPLCNTATAPRCVIAFSSYSAPPPADSIFGRVSSPVNALSGQQPTGNQQVACVNPVAGTTSATGPIPTTVATTSTTRAKPKPTGSSTTTQPAAAPNARTSGPLVPFFPTTAFPGARIPSLRKGKSALGLTTPWVSFPRLYRATCESQGGATWLQVDSLAGPGDPRPVVQQTLGPAWGLHLVDVNVALGNLVTDLLHQAQRYGA